MSGNHNVNTARKVTEIVTTNLSIRPHIVKRDLGLQTRFNSPQIIFGSIRRLKVRHYHLPNHAIFPSIVLTTVIVRFVHQDNTITELSERHETTQSSTSPSQPRVLGEGVPDHPLSVNGIVDNSTHNCFYTEYYS